MFDILRTKTEAKYEFLTNYLKAKIENDEYMDKEELKRILIALEVKFQEIEFQEKGKEENE